MRFPEPIIISTESCDFHSIMHFPQAKAIPAESVVSTVQFIFHAECDYIIIAITTQKCVSTGICDFHRKPIPLVTEMRLPQSKCDSSCHGKMRFPLKMRFPQDTAFTTEHAISTEYAISSGNAISTECDFRRYQ